MILLDWVRAHHVAIKDGASCQERLWLFFVSQPGAVFIVADLPSLPYLYLELYGTLPYIPGKVLDFGAHQPSWLRVSQSKVPPVHIPP